jgi:hypothetical protein
VLSRKKKAFHFILLYCISAEEWYSQGKISIAKIRSYPKTTKARGIKGRRTEKVCLTQDEPVT